ncbi:MAG: hypothetical protein H6710_00075 [Myxococcales bacterium]|nr:hypothetical protein [Myxococcales bacterium]MCB9703221.1 hypothetical protein [Myxococcales bacterium]
MLIEVGSRRYKELFGFRDFVNQPFESRLPPHKMLVEALADPSKSIDAIDSILADARPEGILNAAGLQDLQLGVQVLVHGRIAASRLGGALSLAGNGMLTSMTDGLVDVMKQVKIPSRASNEDIQRFLADAAFAIGMKALGALGPIGKIAAAIVGFARGIIQLVKQRKELAGMEESRRRALAYAKLPPLQEPDTNVDAWYVDAVMRPMMETGSWTPIFSPRFDSDEWKVIRRNGGMAMAPGRDVAGVDDFGEPQKAFKTAGGVGFMPGLDQITSVIQVAKDPEEVAAWSGSGRWPIRPEMVTDVGKFFVNTGRLAAIAWSWVTEVDASPDLYKVHVAALHERWRRYCDAGLRFLAENAKDWLENNGKGRILSGSPHFAFGSAIGCAIGVWRCFPKDNGWQIVMPGVRGDEMKGFAWGRESLGCVIDPPSMAAFAGDKPCVYTIYDLRIREVLDEARKRQSYFLRHSLVAAYVRADFDAFQEPKLRRELMAARKMMLGHPDRMLVQLDDVAEDEPGLPGDGKTWKEQLIASGVKRRPPFLFQGRRTTGGPQPGTLEPPSKPPPRVLVFDGPIAWGDLAEPGDLGAGNGDATLSPGLRAAAWALGGILLGGGAYALARHAGKGWR